MKIKEQISRNFSMSEMCNSSTARRAGIDNTPREEEKESLRNLVVKILQPIRNQFGRVRVNSGFRGPELECLLYKDLTSKLTDKGGMEAVYKWLKTKSHPRGEAADIEVPGVDNRELYEWIKYNLDYDQLILEYYDPDDPSSGWIHVSTRASGNRVESFRIG